MTSRPHFVNPKQGMSAEQIAETWETREYRTPLQNEVARLRNVQTMYNRRYRKEQGYFRKISAEDRKFGETKRSIEKIQERRDRQYTFTEVWDDCYHAIDADRELDLIRRRNLSDVSVAYKSDLKVRRYK